MVGLSRQRIYTLMKDEDAPFPAGVRVSKRAIRWRKSEIEAWLSRRPRAGTENFVGFGNFQSQTSA